MPSVFPPPSGSGTVTSVGLSAPAEFAVTGSPVTGSGTLGFAKNNQAANLVYAGPASGAAAAPAFRALASDDVPALAQSKITGLVNDLAAKAGKAGGNTFTGQQFYTVAATGERSVWQASGAYSGTAIEVQDAGEVARVTLTHAGIVNAVQFVGAGGSITDLNAGNIASGTLGVGRGGTGADLSATGGAGQFLKQSVAGGAVTAGTIGTPDLPSHSHTSAEISDATSAANANVIAKRGAAGACAFGALTVASLTSDGEIVVGASFIRLASAGNTPYVYGSAGVAYVVGASGSVSFTNGAISASGITNNISTQKVIVSKAGATVGTRKQLNLIEGANVTLTMADDAANDRVNVTVAAAGGATALTGRVSADVSTSSTTLGDITGLASFTLAANTNYRVRAVLYVTTNAATVGIHFGFNFTGTLTYGWLGHEANPVAASGQPGGGGVANGATATNNAKIVATTAGPATSGALVELVGLIEVGASGGTYSFRFASETATSTTVKRGSFAVIEPIA